MILFLSVSVSNAQNHVDFEISSGIYGSKKATIERQMRVLLSTFNDFADKKSKNLNLTSVKISNQASQGISMIWENVHFRTTDQEIVERCLEIKNRNHVVGYQIRGIEVDMIPQNSSYKEDLHQEICVDFDVTGQIVDFNIAMDKRQYQLIMKEGEKVGDLDKRMQIIQWCEQFKNAYIKKDIDFLDKIFSEDALIITGRITSTITKSSEIKLPENYVRYTVQDKKSYISNLTNLFNNKRLKSIDVQFSDYRVQIHSTKPNYYGVTLIQNWATNYTNGKYTDTGYLFLLWDFTNEDEPQIHVRSWQPKTTLDNDIFTIESFDIP